MVDNTEKSPRNDFNFSTKNIEKQNEIEFKVLEKKENRFLVVIKKTKYKLKYFFKNISNTINLIRSSKRSLIVFFAITIIGIIILVSFMFIFQKNFFIKYKQEQKTEEIKISQDDQNFMDSFEIYVDEFIDKTDMDLMSKAANTLESIKKISHKKAVECAFEMARMLRSKFLYAESIQVLDMVKGDNIDKNTLDSILSEQMYSASVMRNNNMMNKLRQENQALENR